MISSPDSALACRLAVPSEQRLLEDLQRRASLNNAGDREALLAHPDAIALPLEQPTRVVGHTARLARGRLCGPRTRPPVDQGTARISIE